MKANGVEKSDGACGVGGGESPDDVVVDEDAGWSVIGGGENGVSVRGKTKRCRGVDELREEDVVLVESSGEHEGLCLKEVAQIGATAEQLLRLFVSVWKRGGGEEGGSPPPFPLPHMQLRSRQ